MAVDISRRGPTSHRFSTMAWNRLRVATSSWYTLIELMVIGLLKISSGEISGWFFIVLLSFPFLGKGRFKLLFFFFRLGLVARYVSVEVIGNLLGICVMK